MPEAPSRAQSATAPRAPSARQLELAVAAWQQLQARFAADDELRADEAAIVTALGEANVDDPRILLTRTVDAAVWAARRSEKARELAAQYQRLAQRYDERNGFLRNLIEQLLSALELNKHEATLANVAFVQAPPSLVVTNEAEIPDEWFAVVRTLRRRDLANHINETGEIVPGATLNNGGQMLRLVRLR
jgi:hypothetical protein